MPVKVLPAEDADMPRIFEVACRAFGAIDDPIWPSLYPHYKEERGRKAGAERMTLIKKSDPNTTYLKAVDDETGEIMGMAKWNIWTKETLHLSDNPQGALGEYDTEDDKKYAKGIAEGFTKDRNAAKERTSGNLVSLDILTVDPAHQRKKVGDALVRWGLQRADELNFEIVVESSPYGKGLYEKNGFVWEKDVSFSVPGFEDRRKGGYAWLVRPKQKGGE